MSFKVINNVAGWVIFAIAATVFILTAESTASFWDCGEFIACSYKLQVPHPPGAPLFLLIGRLFSFLALGDVTQVAHWINISSALSSAFTILFLYWTIVLLAKKVLLKPGETPSPGQIITLVGSGAVGALAYTFSDSFWFSAVEAEVYALSSFFTAFVFWAILKWEEIADEEGSDRWIILIAYMMGLSIGVHLLNLVTIPALGLVYYFKRYKTTTKGILIAMGASGAIIIAIMSGIIPGLPSLAGKFEIFFVNSLSMPFGYGVTFFIVLFLAALVYGFRYSIKKDKPFIQMGLIALTFVLIGYISYGLVLIRSNFNPPLDENNPEDVISFVSYLKREQYGDRPLLFGPTYRAELVDQKKKAPKYRKGENKYEVYSYQLENIFDQKNNLLFPRLGSKQPGHAEMYENWMGIPKGKKPTMGDNLTFFFRYQLGHMYWRYFLWNFSGRAGDIQDSGWLAPWDSDKGLPELLRINKARNNFFMLPLILGILGLAFHYKKSKNGVLIVGLLFFLTGIALSIYLNSPPIEPRERDYIFVGSFYAFAIWIGFGVLAISELLNKVIKNDVARPALASVLALSAPAIMAVKGWDDHNRSDRWHSVDSAKNLLNSCAKNAILFTGGDNDTFPLWYVQEVEGFRTDVRVCNLSLLNTDWYIQQMKRKAYESDPLPISLEFKDFVEGQNDYIPFYENPQAKNGMFLPQYLEMIRTQNPIITMQTNSGSNISTLPTDILILPIDTASVSKMDFVDKNKAKEIPKNLVWSIGKGGLEKSNLVILDILANNNWKRPVYFSTTLAPSNYINLREYMQMEGLAMRLMPYKFTGETEGSVKSDIMFENMMKKMWWRGLDNPAKYFDDNYRRFPLNSRKSFYHLAAQLFNDGETEKAKEVVNYCLKVIPDTSFPYDAYSSQFVGLLFKLGEEKKAMSIAETMVRRSDEELTYFKKNKINNEGEIQSNLFSLNQIVMAMKSNGKNKEAEKYDQVFRRQLENYQQ